MVRAINRISSKSSNTPLPTVHDYNGGQVPAMFKGMRMQMVFLTPQMAKDILQSHSNFRNLDARKAAQYADVMERGEWGIFPPICIGQEGQVQDGQHRLQAIVLCGKGQWIGMVTGLPGEIAKYYDNGRPRRPSDVLRYDLGAEMRTSPRRLQSILQLTHYGSAKPEPILNCDFPRLYEKYRTAVARFSGIFGKPQRHCPAIVVAAFCRAWLSLSKDPHLRDELYGAAIRYGEMEFDTGRMNSLRLLCQWMIERDLRSLKSKREAYFRAANAIQAFLKRKTVKRLVPATTDPFRLS